MNASQAEFLKKALEYSDQDVEVYPDYSGRCMYGRITIGLVGDFDQCVLPKAIVTYMKDLRPDELEAVPDLNDLRWDEMGLQKIVY